MSLPTIRDAGDLKGKRVLVRVDWNVPLENGVVRDDFRITQSMPTVNFLREAGAKVVLMTHLEPETLSVEPLRKYVPEGVELLENLRNNPGEKANDEMFAKSLAEKADIYVNEAFSCSHRSHASIVGVPKFLPGFIGFEFAEEVAQLSKAFNPPHPFLFILGGAKFDTKIPLVNKFIQTADFCFVGGALAHNFFKEEGGNVGASLVSDGDFHLKPLMETGKILLPIDMLIKTGDGIGVDTIDHVGSTDRIVDAGPKTLELLKDKIQTSEFILWNGPLGNYEEGFKQYTLELATLLAESGKETILGGADTLAAIKELGIDAKFTFVSAAGGAMLDFLANETLPGIEALKR